MEQILISVLLFVSRDFEFGRVSVQFMLLQLQLYSLDGGGVRRRPSVPYRANFLKYISFMTKYVYKTIQNVFIWTIKFQMVLAVTDSECNLHYVSTIHCCICKLGGDVADILSVCLFIGLLKNWDKIHRNTSIHTGYIPSICMFTCVTSVLIWINHTHVHTILRPRSTIGTLSSFSV